MKLFSSAFLLISFLSKSDAYLQCLSQTTKGVTNCVINECAAQADACTFTSSGEDTCGDLSTSCTDLSNECCTGCDTQIASLLNCVTGTICDGTIDCSLSRRLHEEEQEAKKVEEVPRFLQADNPLEGFDCLSEATGAYTKCVLNKCPGADKACTGTATDGDTCDDVTNMCKAVTADCCPDCQGDLEKLLNCATGT